MSVSGAVAGGSLNAGMGCLGARLLRVAGSVTTPCASSSLSKVKQEFTLLWPVGVVHSRWSQTVRANSFRLRWGNSWTVSCTCANCLRVNRRPLKVVLGKVSTVFIEDSLSEDGKEVKRKRTPRRLRFRSPDQSTSSVDDREGGCFVRTKVNAIAHRAPPPRPGAAEPNRARSPPKDLPRRGRSWPDGVDSPMSPFSPFGAPWGEAPALSVTPAWEGGSYWQAFGGGGPWLLWHRKATRIVSIEREGPAHRKSIMLQQAEFGGG